MSFIERILNNEIISIPKNIKRYFISRVQSAMICLLSFIDNQSNIITLNEKYLKEISFDKICYSILKKIKIKPLLFHDISKIDNFRIDRNKKIKLWPIYIFKNIQKNEKKLEKLKIELKSKEYLLTIKDKLFISYKINISNYINFDKKIKRFKNIINSKKTSNLHYEDIITLVNSTLNIRLKKLKTKDHLDKII